MQICSVSIQHKRNSDGRVGLIKHRESSMGILYRYAAAAAITVENLAPNRSRCLFSCLFFFFVASPTQEQIHHFHQEASGQCPKRGTLSFKHERNLFPLADVVVKACFFHLSQEPLVLTTLISLFVRLHSIVRVRSTLTQPEQMHCSH